MQNSILAELNPLEHVVMHPLFDFTVGTLHVVFSNHMFMVGVATALLLVLVPLAMRSPKLVPGGGQNLIESICVYLRDDMAKPVLHELTDKYIGFLWTIFFFVLTLNLARDQRRRASRTHVDLDEVDQVELTAREQEPARHVEGAEALAAARTAIFRLKEQEKEVFLLRVSGELSFEAIGTSLGIPVGTAKTRMRTALRELRRKLRAFAPGTGSESEPGTEESAGRLGAMGEA